MEKPGSINNFEQSPEQKLAAQKRAKKALRLFMFKIDELDKKIRRRIKGNPEKSNKLIDELEALLVQAETINQDAGLSPAEFKSLTGTEPVMEGEIPIDDLSTTAIADVQGRLFIYKTEGHTTDLINEQGLVAENIHLEGTPINGIGGKEEGFLTLKKYFYNNRLNDEPRVSGIVNHAGLIYHFPEDEVVLNVCPTKDNQVEPIIMVTTASGIYFMDELGNKLHEKDFGHLEIEFAQPLGDTNYYLVSQEGRKIIVDQTGQEIMDLTKIPGSPIETFKVQGQVYLISRLSNASLKIIGPDSQILYPDIEITSFYGCSEIDSQPCFLIDQNKTSSIIFNGQVTVASKNYPQFTCFGKIGHQFVIRIKDGESYKFINHLGQTIMIPGGYEFAGKPVDLNGRLAVPIKMGGLWYVYDEHGKQIGDSYHEKPIIINSNGQAFICGRKLVPKKDNPEENTTVVRIFNEEKNCNILLGGGDFDAVDQCFVAGDKIFLNCRRGVWSYLIDGSGTIIHGATAVGDDGRNLMFQKIYEVEGKIVIEKCTSNNTSETEILVLPHTPDALRRLIEIHTENLSGRLVICGSTHNKKGQLCRILLDINGQLLAGNDPDGYEEILRISEIEGQPYFIAINRRKVILKKFNFSEK